MGPKKRKRRGATRRFLNERLGGKKKGASLSPKEKGSIGNTPLFWLRIYSQFVTFQEKKFYVKLRGK
ncbi:MAG: hypothetical protein A2516_00220 [Alphaproteobacteria bacterium RIFOXYD12_FULL_60_8]|nr:MAG: hypothetical protein A2516_00220 [Alphaproteobacteria bacterium RIFOXYD12_FULL_60_8]